MTYDQVILDEANHGGLPMVDWSFDEVSGTTTADAMTLARGTGYTGTHAGSYTLGQRGLLNRDTGASILHDGSTSATTSGSVIPSSTLTSSLTLLCVFSLPSIQTGNRCIASLTNSVGNSSVLDMWVSGPSFGTPANAGGAVRRQNVSGSGTYYATGRPVLSANTTYCWVAVYDATAVSISLYHQGALHATLPIATAVGITNGTNLVAGARQGSGGVEFRASCLVSRLVLFNRVLSAERINLHALAALNGSQKRRVA